MPDLKKALRDFVATSNSGKYSDEKILMSKFPELKGYDVEVLRDFVATSNSGKYKTEEELFSKFPEFNQGAPVKKKFGLDSSSEVGSSELPKSPKTPKKASGNMLTLNDPGVMESVKEALKNAPKNDTERYFKNQQKELKQSLAVIKETKARQIEEKKKELYQQKEADKANLGLRTRKDFTTTLNSVVNSNLTSKTEENAIADLRKNFEKYGISFEESGFGTDKIIARTVDGKKSIEIDFDNWTTGGNVEAANKLKDFIGKNASEIQRAQSGDFLNNSLKAQKLRSVGRLNSDGSTSTVKFTSFEEDGKFKVIPTLFPKDPNNYSTNPNSWTELQFKDALKLARERGEVFEFKTDKEAKQFAKGAWKDISPIDAEADKFYKQKGLDYMSNKKTYEEYVKVRDMVDFIEERRNDKTIGGDERAQKYSQLLVNGRFRSDVDKLLEKYKTQEKQLRSQVFDAGFVSDGKIQKTREEFDVYLDKRQNKVAQEAAQLNAKAKVQAQDAEVKSVDMFGLPVKDLMKYKPKNEQEAIDKSNIIKLYEDSKLTQNFAAKKYENAKTYFDSKVNKQIKGEYEDNWSAFSNSVSDAYKNGKAAEQILAFTLGIKDVNNQTDKADAARIIVENLTNQSANSSRAMARWQQASGFSEGLDAFLDNPFELMTTMAATSLSQILPYGMKIVPSTTAAGAGTGAVTGLLGGPFAEVTVPGGALAGGIQGFRGGMAATSLAMEYTNSVLDVMREKGYDVTDPNQVEQALSQEQIWKEGGERGLKRGIPIAVVDYLSAGLAGKVFKPASSIASTGTKVATQVAERAVFDPFAEATGELAAQMTAGQEIDWKEISAEAMGGLGNNSSNMAINTYRTVKNNTDINIANNLTDVKFLGTESASDERISSWANNMQQLGKIDADVNQRIQENVGLRRDAREAMSVGTDKNTIKPSVLARTMELMSAKEELSSSVNRRELYSDKIKAINEELKVIADTKELAPEEQSIDLNTTLGTTKQGVSQYMIDGIRYTKEQFLEKTKNMSARRMLRSAISVNNDEEIGNELKQIVDEKLKAELSTEELTNLLNEEEDAIQIESTTEVPVQSETGISETVEEGISEPKPEVVTEKSTEEEVEDEYLGSPTITTTEDGELYEFRTKDGIIAGVMTSPTEFRIDGISAYEVGKGQGTRMFEALIDNLKTKGVTILTTKSAGEGAVKMHDKAVNKGLLKKLNEDGRNAVFEIVTAPQTTQEVKEPTIVVHGAVNGFGLQYSEGINTEDIVKPEDGRGFLPEEQQISLNKGESLVKVDNELENGEKSITILTPSTDNFGRSAVNTFDFTIPQGNTSTASGIQNVLDNVRNGELRGKELIDESVNQVKEYINSNKPVAETQTEPQAGLGENIAEQVGLPPAPEGFDIVTEKPTEVNVESVAQSLDSIDAKVLEDALPLVLNIEGIELMPSEQYSISDTSSIAQAYKIAKEDGSNPELVKAVESLLPATAPQTIIEEEAVVQEAEPQVVSEVEAETNTVEGTSQEINEQDLPGYDRAMSEVEGIIEKSKKRKVSESKIADNVMSYVMGSKVYEDATDVQREALVRDVRKRFGLKEKAAPSVAKLFGKLKDVRKVIMTEKAALEKQITDQAKGGRYAAKAIKEATKSLIQEVKDLRKSGKINKIQEQSILNRLSNTNVLSEKATKKFIDYATKVYNNADYANKISEAKGLRSSIKKLSKDKEKNANLRVAAAQFGKIDPELVEDIDMYNDMASKIKEAIKGSTIRLQNVKFAETVNIQDATNYTSKTLKEQEQKIREEMIAELQDLMGVDASEFTAEEMLALLEPEAKTNEYNEGIVRATIKKAFDVYSAMISESIKSGKDIFTDEDVEYSKTQKELIKKFMSMDTYNMDVKDSLAAVDSLMNFLTNQSTAKMEAVVRKYAGQQNAAKIRRENIFAIPLKKLGSTNFGRFLGEQTTNLNVLFEKMFVGVKRSSKVRDAMGLTDLINGKSKAQRQLNTIVANYVYDFYKKEANNQKFNTLFNNVERGMTSFVSRNIIGTEAEMQAEFDRRKKLIEESIEVLSVGNDQERKKGLEYQKVYDKILDGSTNIREVQSKVDPTNLKAVDFWIKEWDSKFDELSDTALNIYNKVLDKDLNYTPDRFTKMSYDTGSIDLVNTASAFITNTNGNLYKKETGVLMEATRPDKLPKNEDTNEIESYIDLSFDNNNSNSMYDALVDINTAGPIRQVESFMKTSDFRKIFGEDADLIRGKRGNVGRVQQYINNIRNKNPYSNDEFSKTMTYLNKVATLGVSQALAGPTQPFKQVIPVVLNTLANTKGNIDFSAMSNKDFMSWLNDSGYAIASRGVESQADVDSINKLIEQAAETKGAKFVKLIEDANKKWLKMFLVKPDAWVAIASWKSYYEQSLREKGIDTKGIDYSNHEINKDAADYAQIMVDRQQNISDTDMSGALFSDRNPKTQALVKIFMPFASFRMNQASRLGSDLRVLSNWEVSTAEDRKIAARSLAGYAVEMATFRTISAGIGIGIASMTASLMGRGEDEEEKKKRRDNLIKGAATSTVTDILSPIPVLDKLIQNGAASLLETVQKGMDISEKDRVSLYKEKVQNFVDGLGTFGIAAKRAEELWDMLSMSVTGEYKDEFGKERKISVKDKNTLAKVFPAVLLANLTGLASPEVSAVGRNAVKISKKKGLTPEEELEAFEETERILKLIDEAKTPQEKEAAEKMLVKMESPEEFEQEKEYVKFLREEGLKDEKTGITYDNLKDLKRYNRDLYDKNFGPDSEYYKLTIDDKEAKKELNQLEQEEKDKEYNYIPKRKTKRNKDGSRKSSYSYKRTSGSGSGSSKYSYKKTNADGSSTTIRGSRTSSD